MGKINAIKERLLGSKLFKDSFWAVFGNGMGNALFLISGIIVARLLGKDVYGEYGLVKSTMFYIAMFACFGLGTTSTKYIANFVQRNPKDVRSVMRDAMKISLYFSLCISILLVIFASPLAEYLNKPQLASPLRHLAVIVIFKALNTTQNGLLAGFKAFKRIAINSMTAGVFMFILCIPLTYFWGINGALATLTASQFFNFVINALSLRKYRAKYKETRTDFRKELLSFSLPIALQEGLVSLVNWVAILMLAKLSSTGEVGLYSASIQWNAIVSFIPTLLINVILSYITGAFGDKEKHDKIFKTMVTVNVVSTLIPVSVFLLLAPFIVSFYGTTFYGMENVIRILLIVPVFESCGAIFKAEYIAANKNWWYLGLRLIRDCFMLISSYLLLRLNQGENGAMYFAISMALSAILFFILLILGYLPIRNQRKQ